MHGGVLEAIIPFLDYHEKLDGIDFRRAVFVFLSNTGGDDISAHALAEYLKGNRREAITLGDMERVISRAAYNEEGLFIVGMHGRSCQHRIYRRSTVQQSHQESPNRSSDSVSATDAHRGDAVRTRLHTATVR